MHLHLLSKKLHYLINTGAMLSFFILTGCGGGGSSTTSTQGTPPSNIPGSKDTIPPVIHLLGSAVMTINKGTTFIDPGATVTDNIDTNITATVIGTVQNTIAGTYLLTYNATDSSGNKATSVTRTVKVINQAPTISIASNTIVYVNEFYYVKPMASDINKDPLTFSILNKPSWARFDTATGTLSGTPSNTQQDTNITISVSDGSATTTLPPFTIVVKKARNIAKLYGMATQGTTKNSGYTYYYPPSNAIDGNFSTYNHTRDYDSIYQENWLQVALPKDTNITKIIITSRNTQAVRLNGAKVYLLNTSYPTSLTNAIPLSTLKGVVSPQIIIFKNGNTAGNYLLIKGAQSVNHHMHIAEVEIYGKPPVVIQSKKTSYTWLIPFNQTTGFKVGSVAVSYYQNNPLYYHIDRAVPFTVDTQGSITVNGTLAANTSYRFNVIVTDKNIQTAIPVTVTTTPKNIIDTVVRSGDIITDAVTETELIDGALQEITKLQQTPSLLTNIYQNSLISYIPGNYYSQLIDINGDTSRIFPLIYGDKNNTLAVAGTKKKRRFSFFASSPMRYFGLNQNLPYEPVMKRVLFWLMGGEPILPTLKDQNKTIALSFVNYKTDIVNWLTLNFPKWQIKTCETDATLQSCYRNVDLILLGQNSTNAGIAQHITQLLNTTIDINTSVLYMHPNWGKNTFAETIASYFNLSMPYGGNYWANDQASWMNVNTMYQTIIQNKHYPALQTLLTHFKNMDYMFDWTQCTKTVGTTVVKSIDGTNCSAVPGLTEFLNTTDSIQKEIDALDTYKNNIFASHDIDYKLQKILILLADKIRQNVIYPMDKVTTNDTAFMKSLYADKIIHIYRNINPVQPDIGNFSRSDFTSITPTTRVVNLITKVPFRATGAYALPGQTVIVTRLDNTAAKVRVKINSIRSGATHLYEKNGYNRPKYLSSQAIEIKPGERISITSPYGGLLHLYFDQNDYNVSVKFDNVGEHPFWKSSADDQTFKTALNANLYDWAEIATTGFEVHSKRDKMLTSINNFRWGNNLSILAQATKTYASSHPMAIAGFKGPGIETINDITNYVLAKGIPLHNADFVKHMNADQANCGYGCSGNPYDAYWAFDPVSHGDVHEIGHSLEKSFFRFTGWEGHASTNHYAYYTQMRYNQTIEKRIDLTPTQKQQYYISNTHVSKNTFKFLYEALQNSVGQVGRYAWLQTNLWNKANYASESLFWIEAMMLSQKYATGIYSLSNGYHMLGRIHALYNYFNDIKNTQNWDLNKSKIGFGNYLLSEAQTISHEDWALITFSWASGLDFTNFFDMYGITVTQKAKTQVASFNFPPTKNVFFAERVESGFISPVDINYSYLNQPELPIDGINLLYPY